jgi:hypothetical protein
MADVAAQPIQMSLTGSIVARIRHGGRWQAAILVALALLPYFPWLNNYYVIDDGLSLRLAQNIGRTSWHGIFSGGFNGHLRPLPLATWSVIYAFFGPNSSVPYHAFSLALHVINVLLAWRLLRRWVGAGRGEVAWAGCCLFAAHWYASEAVTYLSALGVLWSMTGTLLACAGVMYGLAGRRAIGWLLLATGMAVALAGGEYGVAGVPLVLAVLVWSPDWRKQIPWMVVAGFTVILVVGLYVAVELSVANRGRLGKEYYLGAHIFFQLRDGIAQLSFPTAWIGANLSFAMLILTCCLGLGNQTIRQALLRRSVLALLLGSIGSLIPFAPSTMGYYGRFLYIAAPFFSTWLLILLAALVEAWPRLHQDRIRILAGGFALLLVANLVHCERRAYDERDMGRQSRRLVAHCERLRHEGCHTHIQLWLIQRSHHIDSTLVAHDLITPAQIHNGSPPLQRPADDIWLMIRNHNARLQWELAPTQ